MQLRFYSVTQGARAYAMKKAFEDDRVVLEDDLSVLITYKPTWIKHDHWVTLIQEKWNTTKWEKKKSATNFKNKTTLVDGHMAKHSCGSATIGETKHRLLLIKEEKLKRKITFVELLTYCHSKKGTRLTERDPLDNKPPVFVDPRAQSLLNDYATSYAEKNGIEDVAEMMTDDVELWKECSGKARKGLYGGGIRQDPNFVVTGVRSTHSSIGVSKSSSYFDANG
uniref:uncharacterized protein LOC122586068 isoform X2 n=1 Tax=Erigeron canadensis TaxID=72917 RepID=UPI001CB95DE9|nr:uncharacterized protein LOC122586068 isoform X2 [Erigeron canadensis]